MYQFTVNKEGEMESLSFKRSIDLKKSRGLVKQKVNAILQYSSGSSQHLAVACLSYGYIVVVDFVKLQATSHAKMHKGNITSACFLDNYQYFATSSGSFSRNHDNSIIISKVSLAMQDLFFKKVHTFSNAHGK